jgi:ABC-type Mn2+/Zn2+ transport system permease subunit
MRWQYASFALGILACLIGAFLMFEGSILGENTTGWAIVIGIVGIVLIATSGVRLLKPKKS